MNPRRKLLIGLLAAGVIGGYGLEFARHHHRRCGSHGYGEAARFGWDAPPPPPPAAAAPPAKTE